MTQLGLRLRVFLFFVLMAVAALALAAGGLALGWARADPPLPSTPFVTGWLVFALANTGLLLAIWMLFDGNVAKPINRLSANLRMRAHADVAAAVDTDAARYLGDLAPAAAALADKADNSVTDSAAQIARETARLSAEQARLTAVLTESPVATILINPAREIVLYDAQAASILAQIAPPRLKAPLAAYFDADSIATALAACDAGETSCNLHPIGTSTPRTARITALDGDGHMIFFDPPEEDLTPQDARPLVFDFALLDTVQSSDVDDQPLSALCYVVLDLETTGLSVADDAIVQIGAVRVLNDAIVAGETLSTYVNPGRPIPPAATRVHHISDADVADAPDIASAGRALHHFAQNAVLVAHNAPFDIGFLQKDADAIGARWDHPVLDTVLLSAVAFGTTEEHTLDALCARLGITIPPEERHTALGDARATAEALICLLRMLQGQGYTTFGALQLAVTREARRLYIGR